MVGDSVDATGHRMSFCSFIQIVSADRERRDGRCRLTDGYAHRPGRFAVPPDSRSSRDSRIRSMDVRETSCRRVGRIIVMKLLQKQVDIRRS